RWIGHSPPTSAGCRTLLLRRIVLCECKRRGSKKTYCKVVSGIRDRVSGNSIHKGCLVVLDQPQHLSRQVRFRYKSFVQREKGALPWPESTALVLLGQALSMTSVGRIRSHHDVRGPPAA